MKINIEDCQKKYRVIYADPAWNFKSKKSGGSMKSGASQKYTTTPIDRMKVLPVPSVADENCLLVMWWVGSMPQEAIDLCHAWGFRLVTMTGFVWRKLTKKGKPFFGMGYTTRAGSECAMIAVKGKLANIIDDHGVRSVIEAVVGEHSAKPKEFHEAIEQLCGDVERLEMFARSERDGWDCWGDGV